MRNVPPADEVLAAVERTTAEIGEAPADPRDAFALRVAENLRAILDREAADLGDPVTRQALAQLVDIAADEDLGLALDERVKARDPDFDRSVLDLLLADTARRAEITRPGYATDG